MTLYEYGQYLKGLAGDLGTETDTPDCWAGCLRSLWQLLTAASDKRSPRTLGAYETCWHKFTETHWEAPLFTIYTPIEAVLDYWLDKGLDL